MAKEPALRSALHEIKLCKMPPDLLESWELQTQRKPVKCSVTLNNNVVKS
jgi:hypothetical protein